MREESKYCKNLFRQMPGEGTRESGIPNSRKCEVNTTRNN